MINYMKSGFSYIKAVGCVLISPSVMVSSEINPMKNVPAIVDGRFKLFERYLRFPVLVFNLFDGFLCLFFNLFDTF